MNFVSYCIFAATTTTEYVHCFLGELQQFSVSVLFFFFFRCFIKMLIAVFWSVNKRWTFLCRDTFWEFRQWETIRFWLDSKHNIWIYMERLFMKLYTMIQLRNTNSRLELFCMVFFFLLALSLSLCLCILFCAIWAHFLFCCFCCSSVSYSMAKPKTTVLFRKTATHTYTYTICANILPVENSIRCVQSKKNKMRKRKKKKCMVAKAYIYYRRWTKTMKRA